MMERQLEPHLQSHSPSSITDVDTSEATISSFKRQKVDELQYVLPTDCAVVLSARDVVCELGTAYDRSPSSWDGRGDLVHSASPLRDINKDVTSTTTSIKSRKRFYSDVSDQTRDSTTCSPQQSEEGPATTEPTDSGSESFPELVAHASEPSADVDDGNSVCERDLDCSSVRDDLLHQYSRRTLYIEYWSRTDECKERKWDHLDEIADKYGCAEEHIFATTLNGTTACLEPNMFPYDTPPGIEHWTLWHVNELNHEQIKQYVENWIDANAPHVQQWNYDDNPERSIDIFHVHVYLQVASDMTVLQDRDVKDLVHEFD